MLYVYLSLTKYSAKNPSRLLHCLLTNTKTEKHAYVVFKATEKKNIFCRLIHYIHLGWPGIHIMLKSRLRIWGLACQKWFLLWIRSVPIPGARWPLCVCSPGCSQTLPLRDCGWRQTPARALEMHRTTFRRERYILRDPPAACPLWACKKWQGQGRCQEVWEGEGKQGIKYFRCCVWSHLVD